MIERIGANRMWQRIAAKGCAVTELRIGAQKTKADGRVSSFFFGVYVDIFDILGTPTVGEGVYCHTIGWETKAPRNSRYRKEITSLTGLSDVGRIKSDSPEKFVKSPAVRNGLFFPSWRRRGLAARIKTRPIVLDVLDPIPSDLAGALALAMVFHDRGNPLVALVGMPSSRRNGLSQMNALVAALRPLCTNVETYDYPRGIRSHTAEAQFVPHNAKLRSIYRRLQTSSN